jgi:methylglutaconyl-CoA hydratase
MPDIVSVKLSAHSALCTLSLPEKRNPISREMRDALRSALNGLRDNDAIRAVIITGAGSAFCSGMDLEALAAHLQLSEQAQLEDSRDIAEFFAYIYAFPKPLIAAVNGPAVAGGCGLAVLCDFTLAASDAWFALSEVKIGFVPAIVGVYLERMIGSKRTRDLLLTGRRLSVREAATWGLVNEIVASSDLLKRAEALTEEISQNGPCAIRETKCLFAHCAGVSFEEAINLAVKSNAKARISPECREGVDAFLNKRKPGWRA